MTDGESTPAMLARLLDEHGRALVLYARQWCDSPEDVVQEALLELLEQRQQPTRVVPWLYRVVRNRAISLSRQQRRRTEREKRSASAQPWFEPEAHPLDLESATTALANLEGDLREAVVARIWGDLTFAEIAELVGTSLSTAQRRYEQGMRELHARLEKSCETNRRRPTVR